ncbi:disks large-associated protein 5-like [Bombus bifarius]|uniref:Disks large-associated protein 5-like n=1 Tax=Bombus bifarius TaxID=103933 RepID=A0A6P8MZC5_9HYME|nr:disks large-associated protein 5-like [Bombus bifarius]
MLQKYKACNAGNTEKNRIIRAARYKESRKSYRAKAFNENRNISNTAINIQDEKAQTDPAVEDRLLRLEKWKAEREKRKKVEQRTKKQPFIVGVVHHKIYSPVTTTTPVNTLTTTSKSLPKRVTRATEKRLMNKANEKKNAENSSKNLNVPNKDQRNQKKAVKSFAPEGHKFKAPPGLPKMPLFGKVVVQSMSPARLSQLLNSPTKMTRASIKNHSTEFIEEKDHLSLTDTEDSSVESISLKLSVSDKETPSDDEIHNNNSITAASSLDNNMSTSIWSSSPCEPAFFSPHIVSSRGKSNARKEQQLRRGFSLTRSSDNDIPTKDTVMKNLNISIEEEERTAQYFHFLLNKEINRLNELCEKWAEIRTKPDTTDDGQYEINQAIGQTKLLISKKFERFRRLVNDCETGKGEMLVTCKDLQGFWDMMYIEVRNCDVRFEKLENLRAHAWKEEELFAQRPVAKKKVVKKKVVSTKPSSVKAFLAKKKMKLRNSGDAKELKSKSINSSENEIISVRDDKRLSLLQKVQSSETPKIAKSPLTIIKVSQMCKTPKIQLDDSISYINSNRTPGKSILKQKNFNEIESTVKSANKINFNDHIILNEVSIDEETQTKMDLAAVLSKIDSFDSTEMKINAEKKLYFDDSNSDEDDFDNEDKIKKSLGSRNSADRNIHKIPIIRVEKATPLQEVNKRFNTPFRKITRQNAVDEDESVLDGTFTLDKTNKETSDDIDLSTSNDKLKKYSISSNEETNDQTDNVRILRNRIVTSTGTPMPRRRSSRRVSGNIQETEYKENETPMDRRRRKSRFKINASNNEKTNIELLCYSCNDICLDKSSDKRRSTRSVKFSGIEKECSNRTNKPTQPLTPHVKKSKRKSRSMSMETSSLGIEEKSSQRISRRSQNKKL